MHRTVLMVFKAVNTLQKRFVVVVVVAAAAVVVV